MRPGQAIVLLWVAWLVSWIVAAFWSSRAERRAGMAEELSYRFFMIVGGVLLFVPARGVHGSLRLWQVGWNGAWICAGLTAVGFAFCWWARIHLGLLWSGRVTKKADHHIVETGPYALVRHPIYTGLLLAIGATMVAKGTLYGVAGAAAIMLSIAMKARLEERFLRNELGSAAYDGYARRVPMLVPFLRF